jgi:tetratricopeptide (TPR) repeat protein
MDLNNPVIKLCIEGTRAEFEGRVEDARTLFMRAWEAARDDYDACVSAHYVARYQADPEEAFRWHQEALNRANAVADSSVQGFYPSLYLNLGQAHEMLGNQAEAQRYYNLAAELGVVHQVDT